MAAGQIGTINVGAQLASGPTTSPDTTKDRNFYNIATSVINSTTPPGWDRYNLWGVEQGSIFGAAGQLDTDKILIIPTYFNRSGRIKTIETIMSDSGAAGTMVWGLYANNIDGQCYPGIRVAQSSQMVVNTGGSGTLFTWNPDYQVTAGTLLFFAFNCKTNPVNGNNGISCQSMQGLFGTANFGNNFTATQQDFDLICAMRVASTYGTTPNFLPTVFPVAGAADLYGVNQNAGLTNVQGFAFRFVAG